MITSLAYMRERNWLVSSGKDKRVSVALTRSILDSER